MSTTPPTFTRIDQIPAFWAARSPSAPALIEQVDGGANLVLTRGDLLAGIADARAALAGLGVRRGHRVLLVAENCAALVAFVFACSELGATFVLVNARLSGPELDAIVRHAEPKVEVYIDAGCQDAVAHATRRGAVSIDAGTAGPVRIVDVPDRAPEADHADVAAMIYTSGTTGQPKGVMLTHAGLLFVARTMAAFRHLGEDDRSYAVLPMSHTMGLTSVMLSTLLAGGSVLLRARFDVAGLVQAIERDGISLFQGVPAMYSALLADLRRSDRGALTAPRLRYVYAGGSPLDPTLKAEVEALWGLPLHNGYGMTESSPTICHSPFGQRRADAAVGPPIPGVEVRFVGTDGVDVPPGASGELWMRGPNIMKGYFRDAAATAAVITQGWLRTGDLARQGDDGAVLLVGRLKDIIIRSGFNVYPAEVEAAINTHPAVAQSSVVGRAVDRNEEVVAFVQLKPGALLSGDELTAFLRERVSAYKRPAEIIFLPALPTMTNGKVERTRLKAMASSITKAPT